MSESWASIRKDFYSYLKEEAAKDDSDIDSRELSKISAKKAAVEYSSEFKEFLKTRETASEEEDFTKNAINLDKEEENFLDEMFEDYTSELDEDSKAFKAIDTNGDGKISTTEKNNFFSKIKSLDDDESNVSFSDFSTAIKNIEDGDTDFLNSTSSTSTSSTGGTSSAASSAGTTSTGTTTVSDSTDTQEADSEYENTDVDYSNLDTLEGVETELTKAYQNYTDYGNYTQQYETLTNESETALNEAQTELSNVTSQKAIADETVNTLLSDIDSKESEISESDERLGEYQVDVNSKKESLDGTIDNITSTEASLNNLVEPSKPDGDNDSEMLDYHKELSAYKEQKSTLEAQKQEYEELRSTQEDELQDAIETLQQEEETNYTLYEDLYNLELNLDTAITQSAELDEDQKEALNNYNTILIEYTNNKVTYNVCKCEFFAAASNISLLESKEATLQAQEES